MSFAIDRRTMVAGLGALAFPPTKLIAASRRRSADVALLERAYGLLHPGLLRYSSVAAIDQRLDALDRTFMAGSFEQKLLGLQRFCASIRCGHSFVNPANQSKALHARLYGGRYLPFHFRWLGPAMVVSADPLGVGLKPGTRVTHVDGRSAAEILAALMPYARADGANDGKRRALLSVTGEDRNETFDLYHSLLFRPGATVRLGLLDPAGRKVERSVATIDLAQRRAMRPNPVERGDDAPWWTMTRRGRNAVLTMGDWSLYDSKWDWKAWLDARFAEIADTRELVIDVRGNEGGIDAGDPILARLTDRPLAPLGYDRLARFRTVPADLRPALDTWDKSFFELGKDAKPFDPRFVALDGPDTGNAATIAPIGPRYRGKVVILVDPQNSSATAQFALRAKTEKLATLVGEESGGNQRGINGGAFFFLRLPDSGLEVDLPLIGTFAKAPRPDRGVLPDVAVAPTAQSIAAGRDPALEKALELLA